MELLINLYVILHGSVMEHNNWWSSYMKHYGNFYMVLEID